MRNANQSEEIDVKLGEHSEDEFYSMVEDGMEDAIDSVATHGEWSACKRAIARWVAKIDAEMDRLALGEEHGRDA